MQALYDQRRETVTTYRFKVDKIAIDLKDSSDIIVEVIFIDNTFSKAQFDGMSEKHIFTRPYYKVMGAIEAKITEIEESIKNRPKE